MKEKFIITKNAIDLINDLEKENGKIIIYQGSGCCDGSIPLCLSKNDFKLGTNDILIAKSNDIEFYAHSSQNEYYSHLQLILDITDGNGSEYSLEFGTGKRFILNRKPLN